MKRILIIEIIFLLACVQLGGQAVQQDLKREVTLFNPYKPSLPDFRKRSFLPVLDDTARIKPDFKYVIATKPFLPEYTISPIKAATLQPDPLDKLYKSYVKIGLGNYLTPLAELSITNERSKKGAIGFYARHFSTNGKIKLQNDKRVFAGYMDNDVSLFGKRFFRENFLEGSVDFSQKVRYAYGYDTSITGYDPVKKEILMGYNNMGAQLSLSSLTLDSTSFSYDIDLNYDYFYNVKSRFQHSGGITAKAATTYRDFYIGSGFEFDYYNPSHSIYDGAKYVTSISPFIRKSSSQWSFKLGMQLLLDKNMTDNPVFHIYPDVSFGFSIVPSYVSFFAGLNGKLEQNIPQRIILENPFIVRDGSLFTLKNTDKALIVSAGLKGNTGMKGNYLLSASYSIINNILFYTNFVFPDSVFAPEMGNHFIPVFDDAELLNLHGELNGRITDKVVYNGVANYYKYTLTDNDFAWGKPSWDGSLGLKYNLRDKIIAGVDVNAIGERRLVASVINPLPPATNVIFHMPVHVNFNLSAEYRYTKILSFWFKLNNISLSRYYEWAYYPSQRFIGLVGFTYSL
jgi:hypothetical protein